MRNWVKGITVMLLLFSLLALAACGGGQSETSAPANNGASQGDSSQNANSGGANSGGSGDVLTLKLGHQSTLNSNYQAFSLKFKELVEQKTQGKVKIEIYPARQLGTDRELLEAMQFGNLDLGAITSAPISNFAPQFTVLDLFYLFDDWDHIFRFVDSDVAQELLKETEAAGLKSIAWMPRGFRHVTHASKPIKTPADLQGMKIRVIESPIYIDSFKALGANPQAMSWPDAYTAMQQGAIDGQENTMDIIYEEKVDEVQKYVSKTGHVTAFMTFMASKARFESWPEDVQKAIVEAGVEAAKIISQENKTNEEKYQKMLEEKGMVFNEVNREEFRALVKGVHEQFAQKNGDKYLKAIEALRQ